MAKTDIKVLFISYFFEPAEIVSAQRISYWVKNVKVFSNNTISCDIITSTPQESQNFPNINNVFYVEDNKKTFLNFLIKEWGISWGKQITTFLNKKKDELDYDFVIMSGGPFMQFSIIPFLKKLFECKVILDFRDPFAVNPRFNNSWIKTSIKKYFERIFIKNADHVITVNEFCVNLLTHSDKNRDKFSVIENGFDEAEIARAEKTQLQGDARLVFIYAGTFCWDRSPLNFLKIISNQPYTNDFYFYHIGSGSSFSDRFRDKKNILEHGKRSYRETINLINSADIGLIFTSGFHFESTSKIFDYIGLEKPILIITEGETKTGNLHNITEDYPKIFWAKNNEADIRRTLDMISKTDLTFTFHDKYRFSRKEGLKKLINLMQRGDNLK